MLSFLKKTFLSHFIIDESYKTKTLNDKDIPIRVLNPLQSAFMDLYNPSRHTILTASTNTGKTALVVYLAIRPFLQKGQRVVLIAPTRALVNQIYKDVVSVFGARVAGIYTGDEKTTDDKFVIVATPEGTISAIRKHEDWALSPSLVVIDEVHYLWDQNRGGAVDFLISFYRDKARLLGISATIPEIKRLKKFLKAVVFEYRPKKEHVSMEYILTPDNPEKRIQKLEDILSGINDQSIIIFVPTKELGQIVSKKFSIPFHSADLSKEERELIENDFREGKIKRLVSTSTLAVGVNTPADVVIICGTRAGYYYQDSSLVRQMIGRAGRGNKEGKAFVIADDIEMYNLHLKLNPSTPVPLEQFLLTYCFKPISIHDMTRILKNSFWGQTVGFANIERKIVQFVKNYPEIFSFNGDHIHLTVEGQIVARYALPLQRYYTYKEIVRCPDVPEKKFALAACVVEFKDAEPYKSLQKKYASLFNVKGLNIKNSALLEMYITGKRKLPVFFPIKELSRWNACLTEVERETGGKMCCAKLSEVFNMINALRK